MGFVLFAIVGLLLVSSKGSSSEPDPSKVPKPPKPRTFTHGPYTVELAPEGKGWAWAVFFTSIWEQTQGEGAPLADGSNVPTEAEAAAEAKAWIAGQMDGDAGPQPLTRRGLRLSGQCDRIKVTDLATWIAYASKRVRESGPNVEAGELMADAFLSVFPDRCAGLEGRVPQIEDRTWGQVEASVSNILDKFREGEFASVEPPEEAIAARLVGMSAPGRPGRAVLREYDGGIMGGGRTYLVVTTPQGSKWRAVVFPDPWREQDPIHAAEKSTEDAAETKALEWIAAKEP